MKSATKNRVEPLSHQTVIPMSQLTTDSTTETDVHPQTWEDVEWGDIKVPKAYQGIYKAMAALEGIPMRQFGCRILLEYFEAHAPEFVTPELIQIAKLAGVRA